MKQVINVELDSILYDIDCLTLQQVLVKFSEFISKYGTDATLSIGEEHYPYDESPTMYVKIMGKREETDEEYSNRLQREENWKRSLEERERRELARLTAKFKEG